MFENVELWTVTYFIKPHFVIHSKVIIILYQLRGLNFTLCYYCVQLNSSVLFLALSIRVSVGLCVCPHKN